LSRVIDTNLTGVFYATREVIPHLKRGGVDRQHRGLAGRNYFANAAACARRRRAWWRSVKP
jgi:NAD(P)-dependent dehydrogenase (short-subunit alcohol dehydrogenase family)